MSDLSNTLDLLGKRVRCQGRGGVVMSRFNPLSAHRDCLASFRSESVTIRFEGQLGALVEVAATNLGDIEPLEG